MVTLHTNTGIIGVWKLERQGEVFLGMSRRVALLENSDFTFHADLKGSSSFAVDSLRRKFLTGTRNSLCAPIKKVSLERQAQEGLICSLPWA